MALDQNKVKDSKKYHLHKRIQKMLVNHFRYKGNSRSTPISSVDTQMVMLMSRSEVIARRLRDNASSPHVLFLVPRATHYDLVLQVSLAYRLMFDGAYCSFLLCQDLPKCSICDIQTEIGPRKCITCQQRNKQFLDIAGLPYTRIEQHVSEALRGRAKALISDLTLEECREFDYKGYPLGEIVYTAVARYMLRSTFAEEERSKTTEVYQDFLYGGMVLLETYLALIAKDKPDVVVMVNGKVLWAAVMQAVADRLGIRTVSWEDIHSRRRFMERTWVFTHNKPVVDQDFNTVWQQYKDVPLTQEQNQELDAYLGSRRKPGLFYREMEADLTAIKDMLGLYGHEKPVTMFTNVTWDTAVIDKNIAFSSMLDWVLGTVLYFTSLKRPLLLRVHPAERVAADGARSRERVSDILQAVIGTLPENIKVIDSDSPISSYALQQLSGAAVVYTSTIGFEAALDGLPAIVVGNAHYRDKGFTYDVVSANQYFELLDNIHNLTAIPSQRELARRYAYLYYFQVSMQIDLWDTDRPMGVDRLKINDLYDLAPGKMENLDLIANGILQGSPFAKDRGWRREAR